MAIEINYGEIAKHTSLKFAEELEHSINNFTDIYLHMKINSIHLEEGRFYTIAIDLTSAFLVAKYRKRNGDLDDYINIKYISKTDYHLIRSLMEGADDSEVRSNT